MGVIWAFFGSFPKLFKNCPEAIQEPLGITQWLSYTLSTVTSGAIGKKPSNFCQLFPLSHYLELLM
jgi:hypothetical protein